ncbi:lipoprotein signal peptidase [Kordiimonas sediminis]|uniref:Lipoprotein signal peptidase n=1 Tax=Kordiimonas sediminis TaxID=1735581 RepID=A0A919APF7_9PROT|nr:signal peptidase II [Kordiimonas sediminis]GHF17073.1 lipoprotein signal peptidase [Kordiimonas sediminis]
MIKPGPYSKISLLVVCLILIVDQISKWWILYSFDLPARQSVEILPFFNLTMVWNSSISMGLIPPEWSNKYALIVGTGLISLWVLIWMLKTGSKREAIALAVVLGGAVGNLIDRIIYGAVVDFVHLHAGGYSFYVFNVADSAITLGVILLLIDGLLADDKSPKNAAKDVSD